MKALAEIEDLELVQQHINDLVAVCQAYLTPEHVTQVIEAAHYGAVAHDGQRRNSGEPYITHPIAVAKILADQRLEVPILQAALLHDVIEDTNYNFQELAEVFGEEVARLVDSVSKLDRSQLKRKDPKYQQAVNFQHLILGVTEDPRAIVIKLADRMHNMQTMDVMRRDKQIRISQETLDVYAPIAARLGMFVLRMLLEDLCFKYLYPFRYKVLAKNYDDYPKRHELLQRFIGVIRPECQTLGIQAVISMRPRHLWAIYNKMKRKDSFKAALRSLPVRVLVDSEDECYRILGIIHKHYRPVDGKFNDYIAAPKRNGYRSLHTSVLTAQGDVIHVQIRTREMHAIAELGIIAIWQQQSKKKLLEQQSGQGGVRMKDWLFSLTEFESVATDPLEFYATIKEELLSGGITVFTPKGRRIELPVGATPVDFAYAIHTDIGNTCVAARVNGEDYPLTTPLKYGQTVNIITDSKAKPKQEWRNTIVTSRARSCIGHYFRSLQKQEALQVGRDLLNQSLSTYHCQLSQIPLEAWDFFFTAPMNPEAPIEEGTGCDEQAPAAQQTIIQSLADGRANIDTIEHILIAIGKGDLNAWSIAVRLAASRIVDLSQADQYIDFDKINAEHLHFAPCCLPVAYDAATAYIVPKQGCVIHRDDCHHQQQLATYAHKKLRWSDELRSYQSALAIRCDDRPGVLAAITRVLEQQDSNIENLRVEHDSDRDCWIYLWLYVRHQAHLLLIMRELETLHCIHAVTRLEDARSKLAAH